MSVTSVDQLKTSATTAHPPTQMAVYISIIPPPPASHDGFMSTVSIIYVLLCTVGLLGNAGVCAILIHLLRTIGRRLPAPQVFVYLLGLCVADALLLSTVPILLIDMYFGHWPFGTTACRIHLTLESVTKLLSTFILTALSFDRYLAVCHPHCKEFRTVKCALGILVGFFLCVAVLLVPIPIYAQAEQAGQSAPFFINNQTGFMFVKVKCHDRMPDRVHKAFNIYTFFCGFCFPGIAIVFCYWRLLRKVFWHTKRMRQSRIPIKRVTTYTLLVVTFYFCCWAPYWASNIYWLYKTPEKGARSTSGSIYVYVMYIIHILPYFNSASNWVIYSLLNNQLSEQARNATMSRVQENDSCHLVNATTGRRTSLFISEVNGSEEARIRRHRGSDRSRRSTHGIASYRPSSAAQSSPTLVVPLSTTITNDDRSLVVPITTVTDVDGAVFETIYTV